MSDIMGKLRDEIIESEKARIDLLKWKIILIAGLGVAGLGLPTAALKAIPALLGLIPLVCAYVDVVCVHNDLRILAIGSFIRNRAQATDEGDKIAIAYETSCEQKRPSFSLEYLALLGTTVMASALMLWIAFFPRLLNKLTAPGEPDLDIQVRWYLGVAAVIALLISIIATIFKRSRTNPRRQGQSLNAVVAQLVEFLHDRGKEEHVLLMIDLATHLKANPDIDIAQLRTEHWRKSQ